MKTIVVVCAILFCGLLGDQHASAAVVKPNKLSISALRNASLTKMDKQDVGFFAGCYWVKLNGTFVHPRQEGIYTKRGTAFCTSGSSYYVNAGGSFLYFYNGSDFKGWLVSDLLCNNVAYLAVEDYALYPEYIRNTWQEVINGDWKFNPNIKVTC